MRSKAILKEFIKDTLQEKKSKAGRPRDNPNTPMAREIEAAGGTQAVSEKSGISVPHLNRLQRGVGYPSLAAVIKISSATGQTLERVMSWFKKNRPQE
jgi:DNA-binding phage protein